MRTRLRRRQLALVAVMLSASAAPSAAASGPALDKSFGKAGVARVSLPLATWEGVYPALPPVRQPDGGLLVSAEISRDVHEPPEAIIARFDRRGRVDRSFGRNGSRRFPFRISSVLPLPDGRTLVAGTAGSGETLICAGGAFALVRLRPDGSLDRSFGEGGSVTWRPAPLPNADTPWISVSATQPVLVPQPDGSVVAAGAVCDRIQSDRPWESGASSGFVWARFGANGHVEAPAGSDGAHRLAGAQVSGPGDAAWKRWLAQPGGGAFAIETGYDAPVGGRPTVKMRSFSAVNFADPEPVGGWINVTSERSGLQFDSLVPARGGGLFLVGSEYGDAGLVRLQRVLASGSLDAEYGKICPQPPAGHINGAAETSTGGLMATTWASVIPRRHVVAVLYFSPSGCLERRLNIGPTDLMLGTPLLQRSFRPVIGATADRSLAAVRLVRAR